MIGATIGAALAVSLAAAVIALRRRFVSVLVEGTSMEPTLSAGQRVLVRRTGAERIHCGQLVVLARPTGAVTRPEPGDPPWLIKRVAAVAGDPVPRDTVPALRYASEPRVPAGRLVVLGDNQAASYDSRRAGYFTASTVLGVVVRLPRA
ncbi:S26 family signal peptidase [Actinophytocola sp.]|uniref:S26 family signal peptidase n=1 Tax=Actinophytocola sp. TaxID=1872138 RepID=UPI003D6B82BC